MKKVNKMLAFVLSVVMLATMCVMPVFAAGEDSDILIRGEDKFIQSATEGATNYTTYKAMLKVDGSYQDAEFEYSLDNAPDGVYIDPDTGEIGVPQSVPVDSSFTVRASLASNPARYSTKTVQVVKSTVSDKLGDGNGDIGTVSMSGVGKATVSYTVKGLKSTTQNQMIFTRAVPNACKDKYLEAYAAGNVSEYRDRNAGTYPNEEDDPYYTANPWFVSVPFVLSDNNTITRVAGKLLPTAVSNDTGIQIKHLIDFDNQTVETLVNGVTHVTADFDMKSDYFSYFGVINRRNLPMYDFCVTTGIAKVVPLSIDGPGVVAAPSKGAAASKVQMKAKGASGVTWSFQAYKEADRINTKDLKGVSIDASTGVLTVEPGSIGWREFARVTAEAGGVSVTKDIVLWLTGKELTSDSGSQNFDGLEMTASLSDTSTSTDGLTVGSDQDVWYVYANGENFNYRHNASYPVNRGRIIVEGRVLNCNADGNNIFGAVLFGQDNMSNNNDSLAFEYKMPTDTEAWHTVQAVMDLDRKTYTIFFDGVIDPAYVNQPLNLIDKLQNSDSVNIRGAAFNQKMNRTTFYHVGDCSPVAYDLSLDAPEIGKALQGSYKYYSIPGHAESGTMTEYLRASSADGVYTAVSAGYVPTADDMGYYFKLRVTPKDLNGLTGTAVETEPQLMGNIQTVKFVAADTDGENRLYAGYNFLPAGDYTVRLQLQYKGESADSYQAFLASYDSSGNLLAVDVAEASDTGLFDELSLPFTVSEEKDQTLLKAFVWDIDSLKPAFNGIVATLILNETTEQPGANPTIYLVGDSIVEESYGAFDGNIPGNREGWGRFLKDGFADNVTVENRAVGGYSTKIFFDAGHWDGKANPDYNFSVTVPEGKSIMEVIKPGDYVFVAMGHNDKNVNGVAPWIGTLKSDSTEGYSPVGTSREDYRANLKRFAEETRAKGANIVFLTSISEMYSPGVFVSSLAERGDDVREVAGELGATCLDLGQTSWDYFQSIGHAEAVEMYFAKGTKDGVTSGANGDMTHTNLEGAKLLAGMVRDLIAESNSPLRYFLTN